MSRPLRIEYSGAIYHIISRGNDQRSIFGDSKSYQKFLNYLEKAKDKFGIVIHAYCLMDNHYHLLMETPNGNLCRTMQYVNSSYTTYYNVKNKRNGHLLQGRYKSILVEKDYWIMHCLYGLNELGLKYELKGGTSLSKGYGIINRFSEDIDIRIDPACAPSEVYEGKSHNKDKHIQSRLLRGNERNVR